MLDLSLARFGRLSLGLGRKLRESSRSIFLDVEEITESDR